MVHMHVAVAGHKGPVPGAVPHIAAVVVVGKVVVVAAVEVPMAPHTQWGGLLAGRFPDTARGIAPEININKAINLVT